MEFLLQPLTLLTFFPLVGVLDPVLHPQRPEERPALDRTDHHA